MTVLPCGNTTVSIEGRENSVFWLTFWVKIETNRTIKNLGFIFKFFILNFCTGTSEVQSSQLSFIIIYIFTSQAERQSRRVCRVIYCMGKDRVTVVETAMQMKSDVNYIYTYLFMSDVNIYIVVWA